MAIVHLILEKFRERENRSECGGRLLQSNCNFASHLAIWPATFAKKVTVCHSFRPMHLATTRDKVSLVHSAIIAKLIL